MQTKSAVKIIIVLLVLLILLLTAILILTNIGDGDSGETDPAGTTPAVTSGLTSTDTREPDPSASLPAGTEDDPVPPDTDPIPPDTKPADTEPTPSGSDPQQGGQAPAGFTFNKTLRSDTGTLLNLRAECRGVLQEDGTVSVTVLLYLDYNSLFLGSRKNCRLSLGDVSETFTVPAINEEVEEPHTQYLCHVEKVCRYGETVSVYARFPFRGSYAGVELENIEIDTQIVIQ